MIKSQSVRAETLLPQTNIKTMESVSVISTHQSCSYPKVFNPYFHTGEKTSCLATTKGKMCLKSGFDTSGEPHVPNITNQAVCFGLNLTSHTHRPQNNHQLKTILFRYLNNATSLILVQSPLSKNFLVLSSERRLNEERVWKQVFWLFDVSLRWSAGLGNMKQIVTPFWRPTVHIPPSFLNDEAARWQKYTQLC